MRMTDALSLLSFAALALLLGFKHSYDADHIVAVANLLRTSKSLREALTMSVSWSLGHMLTASGITAFLFVFRESVLALLLKNFELLVGVMLVGLGLYSLYDLTRFHWHEHQDPERGEKHAHPHVHAKSERRQHVHKHMFGIGIVHGLASNDELLILLTAELGLNSLPDMLAGTALFSLGVVAGMMVFAAIFTYPLLKSHSEKLFTAFTVLSAGASIFYGALMLTGHA